ncbi:hypothetical protein B4Q13_24865, partial [Lacticaseibacillus rhamnosus]
MTDPIYIGLINRVRLAGGIPGRIGRAEAWVGGALKIKPILSIVDDQLAPIERVRTERRAIERMIDYLRARQGDGADAWLVQHIQAPEQAEVVVAA